MYNQQTKDEFIIFCLFIELMIHGAQRSKSKSSYPVKGKINKLLYEMNCCVTNNEIKRKLYWLKDLNTKGDRL